MSFQSPDHAAITTIVESVATLADRSEFDALSRLFAGSFIIDYSSLTQQAATEKTPNQLMSEWAGVLPGFDRTRHALSDVEVTVDGETATAKAKVKAAHWINNLYWQVNGHYDYKMTQHEGKWKITSMTFTMESESGTRDVFGPAIKAAESRNLDGHKNTIAARNKKTVSTFFKNLEEENIAGLIKLFAEDGIQVNPYTGGVFPKGAKGHEELKAYWNPVPGNFEGMQFPIDEILATEDPNLIYVRYRGALNLKNNARTYRNDYYSTFRFNRAGEITEYVEIFDPVVAARAFGLVEKLK